MASLGFHSFPLIPPCPRLLPPIMGPKRLFGERTVGSKWDRRRTTVSTGIDDGSFFPVWYVQLASSSLGVCSSKDEISHIYCAIDVRETPFLCMSRTHCSAVMHIFSSPLSRDNEIKTERKKKPEKLKMTRKRICFAG